MRKLLFALPVIFLVAAGCNSSSSEQPTSKTESTQNTQSTATPRSTQNPNLKTYTNTQYGFEFNYPSTYTVNTTDKTNVEGQLFAVGITSSKNGENSGPASSVSVSVWNNSKQLSLLDWATTNSSFSNYGPNSINTNFKNEVLTGHKAISYSWTGMNDGKTVVIANNQTIILLDTLASSKTDSVWQDFDNITSSFKFTK